LLAVRILLGAPARFMAGLAAPYLAIMVLAMRSVSGSTRALYRHAEQSAASAARAAAEAGEAQLAALQAQMNPHFLFNALNTVAALVRTDPVAAESTVENLSDVLRLTLRRTEETVRTLGDEIDYLRAYLSIEKQRLGERLRIRWDVPEDLGPAELPPMTLQPLVENALRHGPGSRIEGGELRISAAARGGRLCLEVADDGPGFVRGYREGTGLGNLRRRLSTLYGTQASLRVSTDAAGARVTVALPLVLRPHPAPRSSVLT
jgi:two-component system LytT family sensor kinase